MALAISLRNGVHPGKRLESWTREQLEAHAPSPVRTFADLAYADPDGEEIAGPATRLTVTASDLSAGRLRFLPGDAAAYGQEPGAMDVAQAVRASASIPFVFRPARFTDSRSSRSCCGIMPRDPAPTPSPCARHASRTSCARRSSPSPSAPMSSG